jgi:hypothetical protein
MELGFLRNDTVERSSANKKERRHWNQLLIGKGNHRTYIPNLVTSFISYHSSFIHHPSPDRNGYPAGGAGVREGLSVGGCRHEEYEWIAGNSSLNSRND